MTGIVNKTGARSGVIGTTVGTPVSTDASGLTTGTLAVARMAAGIMIQCRIYSASAQTTVTSTSFNTLDVALDCQFTPLRASSDILLMAQAVMFADGSAQYCFGDFYKNASDVTETANLSGTTSGLNLTKSDSVWTSKSYSFLDTCSENSLSEKTYKISARINASGYGYIGWDSSLHSYLIIQEITT